jgi:predicted transcriptional regulator
MAKLTKSESTAASVAQGPDHVVGGHTKVTYSLPAKLVGMLDRLAASHRRPKSAVVSEALAFYFAEQDSQALAAVYAQAANDPTFASDNAEVLADFAALDLDPERER